ncbi:hypothetical protein HDU92_000460 [Lobulomyces angularis]|nr:hypothetical protein HDU92_000460 [Lobulomyces angularis]
MSSGFGTNGGRGRCFPFFQDFAKCYVQANHPKQCILQYEDYQECLFHKKEILRLALLQNEVRRQDAIKKVEATLQSDREKAGLTNKPENVTA